MRWLPIVLLACGDGAEGPGGGSEPLPVESVEQTAVVSQLGFVTQFGGVSEGFDLDGDVSDEGSAIGCGRADYVDPNGVEGIDNAFAELVPILQATEASALESLLAQSIANGELLVIFDVVDPDGDCQLTVWQGEGTPLLGSDGSLLDQQTFGATLPVSAPCTRLADGSIEAHDLPVVIPLRVLNLEFTLHFAEAAVRIRFDEDGNASGILAGGIPMSDFEVILAEDNIAQLSELLRPIVTGLMDLYPDESGTCTALSASLAFDALPAFILE